MMARGGLLLVTCVTLAALGAGCTSGGSEVNPNLLAPKLILDTTVEGTPLVYVHSAFGERAYDVLEVRVDNRTVTEREYAYSLETTLANTSFFLEVHVRSSESRFTYRGLVLLDAEESEARIVTLTEAGRWTDARTESLPYERVLAREGGDNS